MLHHCSFYWSSVKSFLANCFLIIGDHFRLHFYNIRQCQLTISWVAMVTCGPILVFPKVLWMQHLRIIFDFNALDMMQIFKSIPSNGSKLIQNWNCPIFLQVMFFLYLLPDRKYEEKRDNVGKGIRGNSHAVWFHTAPPTRHGQNHHQSAIKFHIAWSEWVNTLRPRQDGRHFSHYIFKCIFFNKSV